MEHDIHAQGSKVNVACCWLDYKENNPDGYEQTQFYEIYNRFVENRYGKRDVKRTAYDLLVIDDFGLMELDMNKCKDLFEIIKIRDSKKPTMIFSQLPVSKWRNLFKDNTYVDACLSRMTEKVFRLECNGRDMRKS